MPFPTKIWQSWKDDSEDPTERTVGFPHQWRAVNPSWRYERITDGNIDAYVRERFAAADPALVDVFTALSDPILKADFLRYLILLREGGVWADIDVYPHRPVAEWVPDRYRARVNLPGSPYSVQLSQYTVLAKPAHPAVRVLMDQVAGNLQRLVRDKGSRGAVTFEDVMSTTGPFAFTRVLMDYFTNVTGVVHTGDEMDRMEEPRLIGDVLVLPKDSFGWLPQEHTHEKGDPMILAEHLFIASWRAGHPG
ncbi:nucleotide-diphospho-sugar transferase [Chaetomium sp. MPI-CAGE-AT-0009]|nr:nucleotide-diphospho-sugar transferase [Chaetomium sp. MPI-CAGE-AT-0009]